VEKIEADPANPTLLRPLLVAINLKTQLFSDAGDEGLRAAVFSHYW